ADMDLVTREDFETVRDLAVAARAENEKLAARIAALESQLAQKA
ncbi:MAG TPA: pyrroline-5-carboxylate reductase, partial [Parvularcula sp.]|nr:pyrroline-5-carboxylate reductase [Parvularcula sp.]HBS32088.1 pyrroline-5-carboxylate reductase [Parvularcula sp.]